MSNPATKAPNFTKENAAEMARRGAATKKANREREKLLLAQAAEWARRNEKADDDQARMNRVKKQIDYLLTDMEKTKSVEMRLKMSAALDRLWKLVQPTNGKVSKQRSSFPTFTGPIGPA